MQWQSSKINWPTLPFSLFNVCSNLISIFISFECFLSLLPLHMCTEFIANLCFRSTSYRQGGCYQNISAYLSLIWRNRVDCISVTTLSSWPRLWKCFLFLLRLFSSGERSTSARTPGSTSRGAGRWGHGRDRVPVVYYIELQTNLRGVFTIKDKAPSPSVKCRT